MLSVAKSGNKKMDSMRCDTYRKMVSLDMPMFQLGLPCVSGKRSVSVTKMHLVACTTSDDDVCLRRLGKFTELGQSVRLLLLIRQVFRKVRDDAAGQRDVAGFNVDACGCGESLHDGKE